jgi:hypothetical protein
MTGNPDDWANAGVAGDGDADGDITLVGDSYLITGFGAHMDGQGDRVDIDMGIDYAKDSSYTLSMWATKQACVTDARFEVSGSVWVCQFVY